MTNEPEAADYWFIAVNAAAADCGFAEAVHRWTESGAGFSPDSNALALHPLTPSVLATVYQRLLDQKVGGRKGAGSYYTPTALISVLLEHVLLPVLNDRLAAAAEGTSDQSQRLCFDEWTDDGRRAAEKALLSFSVCDPACGTGAMLAAAGALLADRLVRLRRPGGEPDAVDRAAAWAEISKRCLVGADLDPSAVQLAKWSFWLSAGNKSGAGDRLAEFAPRLQIGDGMECFVETLGAAGRFDVVLGNPPFTNAIEGGVSRSRKQWLSERFPELRGTADLAYYFLAQADRLAAVEGAVGFVLPRSVLTAPAARALRRRLLVDRPPILLYAPPEADLFVGANVFIALVGLGRRGVCLGGRRTAGDARLTPIQVADENWWAPLGTDSSAPRETSRTLGDRFEVIASMTTGMAYELRPYVVDEPIDGALRFVTTGLIDPDVCRWGRRRCRYLKKDYQRPVVRECGVPRSLGERLRKVRRPKVLVAGLSNRVEAFLDHEGGYCGAVSTFSLFHPTNDAAELFRLCEFLNGASASETLHRERGAGAMGGGRITLSKDFLASLAYE